MLECVNKKLMVHTVVVLLSLGLCPVLSWARSMDYLNKDQVNSTLDVSIISLEDIDVGPSFPSMGSHAIALDRNGYPHIVYGGDNLYHTYYDGATWNTETVDSENGTGEEATIAIDSSGATDVIHVIYTDSVNADLKYATNATGSWVITASIDTLEGTSLSMALDSSGYVHATYQVASAYLTHLTNRSGSWVDVNIDSGSNGTGSPNNIVIDSSDNLHVIYYEARGSGNYGISYATKAASGSSWTVTELSSVWPAYTWPSVALDTSQNLHMVYKNGSTGGLDYQTKPSGSSTWGAVTTVLSSGVDEYVNLVADASNNLYVSFYNSTEDDLKYVHYDNSGGMGWDASATTLDSSGDVGSYNAIVASGGTAHISYYYATNGALKYTTGSGSSWSTSTLANSEDLGRYSSMVLDSAGNIHVAYYEADQANLKYATNTSGSWVAETVDSTGDVGMYASLGIDTRGYLHIAYYDATNTSLKYATNSSGAWVSSTLDNSTNITGEISTLILDAANAVHIFHYWSYTDSGTGLGTTDFMHITNASGAWVSETVASRAFTVDSLAFVEQGDVDVFIDSSGYFQVTFSDISSTEGYYTYYATNMSGTWVSDDPDTCAESDEIFNEIFQDSNGDIHIFFVSAQLNYTTNIPGWWSCSKLANPSPVDAYYPSALIDDQDYLYVAYQETDDDELQFLTSISMDANYDWNKAVLVDSDVTHVSLQQDAIGYFHATFYDVANQDHKYVKFTIDADADGSENIDDCDDGVATTYPGATEICGDSVDNDCDGTTDEQDSGSTPITWYADGDRDGYGTTSLTTEACSEPTGYSTESSDCNDNNSAISPDVAEVCVDGIDNDCDDNIDEGCVGESNYDDDGDGYSENAGDCDDADSSINPGATEICDGVDNDCDRDLDDGDVDVVGASIWYPNFDGDAYGASGTSIAACSQPNMYLSVGGDCNDNNSAIYPGADEVCGDSIDNNCDDNVDEETASFSIISWYPDGDEDGYGSADVVTETEVLTSCSQPAANYVADNSDCNDSNPDISADAAEICSDQIDNNCDGAIDEASCARNSEWNLDADSGAGCSLRR